MAENLEPILQYLNQPNTDYAYMLTGAWGSGKTYFWKHVVVPALGSIGTSAGEWGLIYLPLASVASADEIRKAIIAQLHPVLATGGQWLGLLAPTLLEYFPVSGPIKAGGAKVAEWLKSGRWWGRAGTGGMLDRGLRNLRGDKRLVICFDDLERAAMPPKDVLGQINQFVEHLGAKVVILCNEDELLNGAAADDYRKAKEKVVRITRAYTSDIEQVATAMFAQFAGNKAFHEILRVHRELVLSICLRGGMRNLRSLKYSLLLLETACTAVSELVPGERRLVEQAIKLLLPVTLDLQERRISPAEAEKLMTDGSAAVIAAYAADEKDSPPLAQFGDRYGYGLVGDRLWTSAAVSELVVSGHLDRTKLKAQLDAEAVEESPGQVALDELVEGWLKLPDEKLGPSVEQALAAVRGGEVASWTKLYRLAMSLDWMRAAGALPTEPAEAVDAFAVGITSLMERGAFQQVEPWVAEREFMRHGGEGEIARLVRERLLEANQLRSVAEHRAAVRMAFAELGDDSPFNLMLSEAQDRGFGNRGIAQFITPDEFVDRVLTAENAAKFALRHGINRRYQQVQYWDQLKADIPWLSDVSSRLTVELPKLAPEN